MNKKALQAHRRIARIAVVLEKYKTNKIPRYKKEKNAEMLAGYESRIERLEAEAKYLLMTYPLPEEG